MDYSVGDVVFCEFPFSSLTDTKERPVLLVADVLGDDVIGCLITSQDVRFDVAIEITSSDFESGSLKKISYVRPTRIATLESGLIQHKIGRLKEAKIQEVLAALREKFTK